MATIIDVEKESGVSKSTISRYLQGKKVIASNKEKIDTAISKLGYKVNPIASSLKSSRTYSVGVLLPDITDSFFPPIIKEFEHYMASEGYHVILSDYGNDILNERQQLKLLVEKKVDGIVIVSSDNVGDSIQSVREGGLPVIMIDRHIAGLQCDSVAVNNFDASYEAVCRCIEKGHNKIGAVYGTYSTDAQRLEGLKKALSDNCILINEEYFREADIKKTRGNTPENSFLELIDLKDPPSLIFCSNIYIGIGALKARLKRHLNIPSDMSILVFDDISTFPNHDYVTYIKPEFSSITQPLSKIGRCAAKLLLKRLKEPHKELEPINIELQTEINITDSIAELKTDLVEV